jgi:hypothetical protein
LPIWKDVTEEDVRAQSPILAGKVAVSTTAGLAEVLNQIRLAVDVSERRQQLTPRDRAVQRVKAFRQTVAEKQHSDGVLRSEQGVALVSKSIENLWETIQELLSGDLDATARIQFAFTKPAPYTMYARTLRGMGLNLHATNMFLNTVADTRLQAKIFRQSRDFSGQPLEDLAMLHETEFQPVVRSGDQIVWLNPPATYTTEELAAYLIDQFLRYVEIATQ